MKSKSFLMLIAGVFSLGLLSPVFAACIPVPSQPTADQTVGPPQADIQQSALQRETAPAISSADLSELVSGNTAFGFDLYQELKEVDGNLFYSPYSISLALAITYAGARGVTAQQMAETLHFTLPQDSLHSGINALDLELASRGESSDEPQEGIFKLNIANSIWGQQDYPFLPEFLDVLAKNYGTGLHLLDYINASEQARHTINAWVSDQTEGKIKDLIPAGTLDDLTRLVLANAIYFNANWAFSFSKNLTEEGNFTLLDGSTVRVPLMSLSAEMLNYTASDGFQALELPYRGQQLGMLILLPDEGQFDDFETSLDQSHLDRILSELVPKRVLLTMPKFSYESNFNLVDQLAAMGMPDAFDPKLADFSGMDGTHNLSVNHVLHKAFVSVDEIGTEAAAATGVVIMEVAALLLEEVEVQIDRPFIFVIRDFETGSVLFIGRVFNPLT